MAQDVSSVGTIVSSVFKTNDATTSSTLNVVSVVFSSIAGSFKTMEGFLQYMGSATMMFQGMTGLCGALVAFKDVLPKAGQSALAFFYMAHYGCCWTEACNFVSADNCPDDIEPIAFTAAKKVRELFTREGLDVPTQVTVKVRSNYGSVIKNITNIKKANDLDNALQNIFQGHIRSKAFTVEFIVTKDHQDYQYSYHRQPSWIMTSLFTKNKNVSIRHLA